MLRSQKAKSVVCGENHTVVLTEVSLMEFVAKYFWSVYNKIMLVFRVTDMR